MEKKRGDMEQPEACSVKQVEEPQIISLTSTYPFYNKSPNGEVCQFDGLSQFNGQLAIVMRAWTRPVLVTLQLKTKEEQYWRVILQNRTPWWIDLIIDLPLRDSTLNNHKKSPWELPSQKMHVSTCYVEFHGRAALNIKGQCIAGWSGFHHVEQDCGPRRTFPLILSSLCTKPALGNALLFRFSQLQLPCSTWNSGPLASSPRSELSAKWAAKNVVDFFTFNLPSRSKSFK